MGLEAILVLNIEQNGYVSNLVPLTNYHFKILIHLQKATR